MTFAIVKDVCGVGRDWTFLVNSIAIIPPIDRPQTWPSLHTGDQRLERFMKAELAASRRGKKKAS